MRAVVTGAGVRVGRAIAVEFASFGFEVCVHYHRSESAANEVVKACEAAGGSAWAIQADLASVEGCKTLVDAVAARWDSLDVLVNSAALFEPVPFESMTAEQWQKMHDMNLRAPFLVSQGLLQHLMVASASDLGGPAEQGGTIIHVCDIGADRPVSGYAHYSTSKAGLSMLVKAMAVELAPRVRTVGVSPGQVAWPESYSADLRERLTERIPLKRVGTPEDVARMCRFLATEAFYVNGAVIGIDGGLACKY